MNKNLFYIALIALAVAVFIAQHIRRKTRPFYQALDKKYQDLLAGRFQDPKQARRFKNALAAYETRQYSSALKQLGKLLQSAQDPQDQALCHFIMGCCDDEQLGIFVGNGLADSLHMSITCCGAGLIHIAYVQHRFVGQQT